MYAYSSGMLNGLMGQADATPAKPAAPAVKYSAVQKDIETLLEDDDNKGPTLVRLAWHASGTYDKKSNTGGSDGATMRYNPEKSDGANAGLDVARSWLEPIKAKHPGISYADLWTLAGVTAIEFMGGPKIEWSAGRSDDPTPARVPPNGRLPDAMKKSDHLRDVFYRMGFNDRDIVALSGAHTLGRCHANASGFEGPWTNAPTTMSNLYFVELMKGEDHWIKRKLPNGNEQYNSPDGTLMMLETDMELIRDPKFTPITKEFAEDEDKFFAAFAEAFAKLLNLGRRA